MEHKTACLFLLLVVMTKAMNIPQNSMQNAITDERVHFDVNVGGQITEENIEMNYEENYVRVTTPALGHVQAMVLIHDYTKDLTLFKSNGRCFMLNKYPDVPQKMENWHDLSLNSRDGVVQAGGQEGYRLHNYKIIPFSLNRTSLPAVMQRECEEIDMMVLEGTIVGEPAYKEVDAEVNDGLSFIGAVYLPFMSEQQQGQQGEQKELNALKNMQRRTKRRARGGNWCFICICRGRKKEERLAAEAERFRVGERLAAARK